MASSSGRSVWTDPRTGLALYYDQQTSEIVYPDGRRVPAASQSAQPAVNVPRTAATSAVRQLPANAFSSQPYNQQYTSSPPIASGSSLQNVTQQLRNVQIAQPSTPAIPYAAGRPIDGADVVRNPPILGARRVSFAPTVQSRLLDPDFKVKKDPRKYFVPGRVFLTLWTEPASAASAATSNNDVFVVRYGEHAFCRVRRFVVVRSGSQSCSALAVSTHSGRGSPQANKDEHGIIFTGKSVPVTKNEHGMQPTAIRVNPDDKDGVLDPKSRLNYGKVYNVEHNVKVKNFGTLSPEYLRALLEQFADVFTSKIRIAAVPAPAPLDREARPDMTKTGTKDTQQFLGARHRGAVEQHTRHVNNAAAGGRTAGTNSTGARAQQPVRESIESDDEDGDEEDGNGVEEESSDEEENDEEEGDDDGDDDDDDDEDDDEQ